MYLYNDDVLAGLYALTHLLIQRLIIRFLPSCIIFSKSISVEDMQAANEKEAKEAVKKEEDAKANAGDVEVLDAKLRHANYVAKTGTKEAALTLLKECLAKSVGGAARIDVAFSLM